MVINRRFVLVSLIALVVVVFAVAIYTADNVAVDDTVTTRSSVEPNIEDPSSIGVVNTIDSEVKVNNVEKVGVEAVQDGGDPLVEAIHGFGSFGSDRLALYESYSWDDLVNLTRQDDLVAAAALIKRSIRSEKTCEVAELAYRHGVTLNALTIMPYCFEEFAVDGGKSPEKKREQVLNLLALYELAAMRGDVESVVAGSRNLMVWGFELSEADLPIISALAESKNAKINAYRRSLGLDPLPTFEYPDYFKQSSADLAMMPDRGNIWAEKLLEKLL